MIHLPPLPGSPGWGGSMGAVIEAACADAERLVRAGVDAILVENFGDAPFFADRVPAETVASMARVAGAIADLLGRRGPDAGHGSATAAPIPLGVNVLRNDAAAALAVAAAVDAAFIRVNVHTGGMHTDQGWIQGRAASTVRLRQRLAPGVAILADVLVKHATPPAGSDPAAVARDTWDRGHADALIVSGASTGAATDLDRVRRVREAVPEAPVLVGSGVTTGSVAEMLQAAHGVIVGTALQETGPGDRVSEERARALVRAARG